MTTGTTPFRIAAYLPYVTTYICSIRQAGRGIRAPAFEIGGHDPRPDSLFISEN